MEAITFTCSICGEESRDICTSCTKDTCANHLCERCKQCSDCCVCEVRLVAQPARHNGSAPHSEPAAVEAHVAPVERSPHALSSQDLSPDDLSPDDLSEDELSLHDFSPADPDDTTQN